MDRRSSNWLPLETIPAFKASTFNLNFSTSGSNSELLLVEENSESPRYFIGSLPMEIYTSLTSSSPVLTDLAKKMVLLLLLICSPDSIPKTSII